MKPNYPQGDTYFGKKIEVIFFLIFFCCITFFAVWRLDSVPPLWWDEGWTISVAKNWIHDGHYGLYNQSKAVSKGLAGLLPTISAAALSFKIFGVGVWQARLPFVLITLATFLGLFLLSDRIYSRHEAWGTMFVLLFMIGGQVSPPLIESRQVLGEMPAIFFFLLGVACLSLALEKSRWYLVITCIFIGISAQTKAQMRPFLFLSLTLPIMIYSLKQNWVAVRILLANFLGSLYFYIIFNEINNRITSSDVVSGTATGLINVTGIVPILSVRILAGKVFLVMGLPILLGIIYEIRKLIPVILNTTEVNTKELIRLIILIFVTSWVGWYLLLAMWWPRYLYPALIVGSMYISSLLVQLTINLNIKHFRTQKIQDQMFKVLGLILAIILITYTVPFTIIKYMDAFTSKEGQGFIEVVDYINNITSKSSLIETYDSEIFFLLEREYHFPPDSISVDLIRNREFHIDDPIEYYPLEVDPDHIVIGGFGRMWGLYDEVIHTDNFKLVLENSRYQIYERIRDD